MQETIEDMLLSGTIKQVETPLEVIKSFSVSVNLKGKTWLILDLRHVNDHLDKEKKRIDDWKYFENYLQANKGYLFKFDLKNYYHHINTFQPHQVCLVFYGVLTVPPNVLFLLCYHFACLKPLSYLLK